MNPTLPRTVQGRRQDFFPGCSAVKLGNFRRELGIFFGQKSARYLGLSSKQSRDI